MKSRRRIDHVIALLLIHVCCATGCRAVSRSPFAIGTKAKPEPLQTESAVVGPAPVGPSVEGPAANDAISQQIAAESKALSNSLSVAPNPELAKYASIGGADGTDVPTEREVSARSRSFESSSSSSRSGCSKGCCH